MKFEDVLKELIEKEEKEFTDGHQILFKYDLGLFYRDINQRKEDAIDLKQQPSILSSGWWEPKWRPVKKTINTKGTKLTAEKFSTCMDCLFIDRNRKCEDKECLVNQKINMRL